MVAPTHDGVAIDSLGLDAQVLAVHSVSGVQVLLVFVSKLGSGSGDQV